MAFSMRADEFTVVSVKFVDSKKNPASVDGAPQWLVDNPNVVALEPAADGLSCKVSAVGPIGVATVSIKADADLGAGVVSIMGSLEVDIVSGMATGVELIPGPIQPQNPSAPTT